MTDYVIAPDISHYQVALTTAYPRDFVIFKATQGVTYLDSAFLANAGVAHSLHDAGKLAGAVCYHVFSVDSPDAQFGKIKAAIGPTPPPWLAGIMIDLESWPGTSYEVKGDHSASVNRLYALLVSWLGSPRRVWLYGNGGDLAALAPHRDTRAPIILAAYTSELRYSQYKTGLGQQYTNGGMGNPVPVIDGQALPRATPTIGNCDHNVFPGFKNGAALREWMNPTPPPPPPPPKDWFDMATKQDLTDAVSEFFTSDAGKTAIAAGVRQAIANHPGEFHDAVFGAFNKDSAGNRHSLAQFFTRSPDWVPFLDADGNAQPLPSQAKKG